LPQPKSTPFYGTGAVTTFTPKSINRIMCLALV
jgi:hypothetical protein